MKLAGYNIVEQKILIGNPFMLIYEINEKGLESVRDELIKITRISKGSLFESILLKTVDVVGELEQKDYPKLDQSLKILLSREFMKGSYTYNKEGFIIHHLEITENGFELLNRLTQLKEVDMNQVITEFMNELHKRMSAFKIIEMTKQGLIDVYNDISRQVCEHAFLEYKMQRKIDVEFDHYTGKITIHHLDRFKEGIKKQHPKQFTYGLEQFLRQSVHTMTEVKILIDLLKSKQLENCFNYMSQEEVFKHLLYMLNEDMLKADIKYDNIKGKPFQIKHIEYKLTAKGLRYCDKREIVIMKNKLKTVPALAKALSSMTIKTKVQEQPELKDVVQKGIVH